MFMNPFGEVYSDTNIIVNANSDTDGAKTELSPQNWDTVYPFS